MMRGIKRGLRRQLCMALATLMLTTSVPVESLAGVLPDSAENVDAAAVHTETAVDEQQNTDEGAASLIISDNAYEENEEDEQDDPENEEYLPDPMSEEDSLIEETEIEDLSVRMKRNLLMYIWQMLLREKPAGSIIGRCSLIRRTSILKEIRKTNCFGKDYQLSGKH